MLVTPTSSARCWTDRPAGETKGPKVRRLEGTTDARVVGVTAEEPSGPQNSKLADVTVFAGDRSPAEVADAVLGHLGAP